MILWYLRDDNSHLTFGLISTFLIKLSCFNVPRLFLFCYFVQFMPKNGRITFNLLKDSFTNCLIVFSHVLFFLQAELRKSNVDGEKNVYRLRREERWR